MAIEEKAAEFRRRFNGLQEEIGRLVAGQEETVQDVLICMCAGGHTLLEGVPGLGKTLLVRTLSQAMEASFNRIQFTPDLMPSDVTGTYLIQETEQGKEFQFQQGPVFANIVLADEINRATPKTQSALLESMQERSVTVSGRTFALPDPFMVLATQNPLEMEGTYPLPEAQLDRFLLKIIVPYPSHQELSVILDRTTGSEAPQISSVMAAADLAEMQDTVRQVVLADHVKDYILRLVLCTHPDHENAPATVRKYVRYGSSPRGAQALSLCGKVRALLDSRYNVSIEDVENSLLAALRHRIILNYEAEAEQIDADHVLTEVRSAAKEQWKSPV